MVYKSILNGEKMKEIRILIVEDEAITAKAIESELNKMGYSEIYIAITYEKALKHIKAYLFDLILLDINLKSKNSGITLAQHKEVFEKVPVIFITSANDEKTIQDVLATNPKSYLLKPLRYAELKFSIDLVLKDKKNIVNLGYNFSYDLEHRSLFHNQKVIKLSPNQKLLLERLLNEKGDFVYASVLEDSIWGDKIVPESSLRTLILGLRKKLNSEMIVTISGLGYKIELH